MIDSMKNNCTGNPGASGQHTSEEFIHIFKRPMRRDFVPIHTHRQIELVYIYQGKGILSLEGNTFHVHQGDLLFYNVGQLHCLNSDSEITAINIQISPVIFDQTATGTENAMDFITLLWMSDYNALLRDLSPVISLRDQQRIEIEAIFLKMLKEYEHKPSGFMRMILGYLNILFTLLFRKIQEDTKLDIRQDMNRILDEVLCFIEKNYAQKITIEILARQCFYNPNYFSTIFKECYGVPPIQYVNRKRIEKAMDLLVASDISINQIIHTVGFTDKKFFYCFFREIVGCTPGAFRKKAENFLPESEKSHLNGY